MWPLKLCQFRTSWVATEARKKNSIVVKSERKKMWREISATQVHPSLNSYPQYPTTQPNHGINNKWSITGQRSSYSLPHPGHAQSHMRWQKQEPALPARHLSSSTRNLSTMPSPGVSSPAYNHAMHADARSHYMSSGGGGGGMNGPRPRPASMYDTPSMPSLPIMSYHHQQHQHLNGFMPPPSGARKNSSNSRNGSIGLRQNSGELVSSSYVNHSHLASRWCFNLKMSGREVIISVLN